MIVVKYLLLGHKKSTTEFRTLRDFMIYWFIAPIRSVWSKKKWRWHEEIQYVLVKIVYLCFYLIFYSDVVIMHFTKNVKEKKFDSWSDIDPISRTDSAWTVICSVFNLLKFVVWNMCSWIRGPLDGFNWTRMGHWTVQRHKGIICMNAPVSHTSYKRKNRQSYASFI